MKVYKVKTKYNKIPRAYRVNLEFTPEELDLLKSNKMIVRTEGGNTVVGCRGCADVEYLNLVAAITNRFFSGIDVDDEFKPHNDEYDEDDYYDYYEYYGE